MNSYLTFYLFIYLILRRYNMPHFKLCFLNTQVGRIIQNGFLVSAGDAT